MDEDKQQEPDGFGVWGILELMGHVKMAGFITEEERFGVKMGRIDVPADDGDEPYTQYFGGSAVYRLTPVTETVARAFSARNRPRPVHVYDLALLPASAPDPSPSLDEWEDDEDDF